MTNERQRRRDAHSNAEGGSSLQRPAVDSFLAVAKQNIGRPLLQLQIL
jgi:hypothetical protein